jgi:hypothetical protein
VVIAYKKRLMATSIQKGSLLFVLLLVLIVTTGCGDRHAYDAENDAFFIQIRLLYKDSSGSIQSPPTFVNLTYDRNWKVIDLEFDV